MKSLLVLLLWFAGTVAIVEVTQTLHVFENGVLKAKGVQFRKEGYRFIGPLEKATQTFWLQFPLDEFLTKTGINNKPDTTIDVSGTVVVYQDYGDGQTRTATYTGCKIKNFELTSFNEKSKRRFNEGEISYKQALNSKGFSLLKRAFDHDNMDTPYDVLKPYHVEGILTGNAECENFPKYVYIYYQYEGMNEVRSGTMNEMPMKNMPMTNTLVPQLPIKNTLGSQLPSKNTLMPQLPRKTTLMPPIPNNYMAIASMPMPTLRMPKSLKEAMGIPNAPVQN